MKRLIIIGARNLGREVLSLAKQCAEYGKEWEIGGFLDDKSSAIIEETYHLPVISSVEAYEPQDRDLFVCALGIPEYKKKYIDLVVAKGGQFTNLIHPTSIIHDNVNFGIGIIIQPYCIISNDVILEDFVTVQAFSTVGHDSHCRMYSHLSAYSFLGGGVLIDEGGFTGTRCSILPQVKVGAYAKVGAQSLAIKHVVARTTVFGVPALKIN
ncbi:MAG: sialic acid O-acetyltransferase [Bacteroidetes bacterium]|nr:MAG: sialic acid O-acetyltransferase [Bacteroidota bacterium]